MGKGVLPCARRGCEALGDGERKKRGLDLQNRDGGIPTFCRGWGKLPFDRSGADLTAHALRALLAWRDEISGGSDQVRVEALDRAVRRGIRFLESTQQPDGSWIPLWFGNERAPAYENRSYGTSRVLIALRDLERRGTYRVRNMETQAVRWLLHAQGRDGGWGAAPGIDSSVEESALVLAALAEARPCGHTAVEETIRRGAEWLITQVESSGVDRPTPMGFYFANLWYFEKLYPLVFSVAALGKIQQQRQ